MRENSPTYDLPFKPDPNCDQLGDLPTSIEPIHHTRAYTKAVIAADAKII